MGFVVCRGSNMAKSTFSSLSTVQQHTHTHTQPYIVSITSFPLLRFRSNLDSFHMSVNIWRSNISATAACAHRHENNNNDNGSAVWLWSSILPSSWSSRIDVKLCEINFRSISEKRSGRFAFFATTTANTIANYDQTDRHRCLRGHFSVIVSSSSFFFSIIDRIIDPLCFDCGFSGFVISPTTAIATLLQ